MNKKIGFSLFFLFTKSLKSLNCIKYIIKNYHNGWKIKVEYKIILYNKIV